MQILTSLFGRLAIGASLIAALFAWRATDVSKQQNIGATTTIAKINTVNDNATKMGRVAANKSVSPGVQHPTDPTTRNK